MKLEYLIMYFILISAASRMLIRKLLPHLIEIELLSRNLSTIPNDHTCNTKAVSLRLAYVTTFNSCQGLTLDQAVIDLRTSVLAHDQLYGSVSRIRMRSNIRMLYLDSNGSHETRPIAAKLENKTHNTTTKDPT